MMMSKNKAAELVKKYGKETALEIANMVFQEHYEYADGSYVWRGSFGETYRNSDKCKYWRDVIEFVKQST